jgi:metallo-beta-lactamase family protein
MRLKFIGATETVTGSKHLVLTDSGSQLLLDCGLYQGEGRATDELNRHLGVHPSAIDAVLLSHAHIDHSGNLPLLCKEGFKGPIYCTPATYDVCEILLVDSAHIHESDVAYINKRKKAKGQAPIEPLYTVHDAERCLQQFETVKFDTDFKVNSEISAYFSANGHIIGSAAINLTANESGKITKLCFTGDIGRYNDPLLKAPEVFQQADYIICESTYGDRLHDVAENAEQHILSLINETCVEKKGKLIVPAFSLGRTQEILFVLDGLKNKGLLPNIPVYVDSPLSSKATAVVKKHPESFNEHLQQYIKDDPEPFCFDGLTFIEEAEDSKKLNSLSEPCVIISASGMGDAGRVKHHISNNVGDPNNAILFTGYCAPGTLGDRLLSGAKDVRIYGDTFSVKARIEGIKTLSAHGDYSEMLRFLSCQDIKKVKSIFLVHGEEAPKLAWRDHLKAAGYLSVIIPSPAEVIELN